MESAICLRYCPLSAPLSYGTKGSQNAKPRKFHLRFNLATPLCLPHFSTSKRPTLKHANCMLERFSVPSNNEGSDNKILRGVTGVSLVLACVLGLFNFSSKMNPKFNTAYARQPFDVSPGNAKVDLPKPFGVSLGNGKVALRKLLETMDAEQPEDSNQTVPGPYQKLPDDKQIDNLKLLAVGLSKCSGEKADDARKRMEEQYNRFKGTQAEDSLGMALVELLMFQEKFREARKLLDEQIGKIAQEKLKSPEEKSRKLLELYTNSDFEYDKLVLARLLLYKAIVETMLDSKEAKHWRIASFRTVKE